MVASAAPEPPRAHVLPLGSTCSWGHPDRPLVTPALQTITSLALGVPRTTHSCVSVRFYSRSKDGRRAQRERAT